MFRRLLGIILLAAVMISLLLYSQQRREPLRVSGFIEAHEIRIGSRVGGRVHRVRIEEGASVQADDVLVELEPFQLQEMQAQASALLAEATAARDKIKVGFRVEEIAQAKAHHDQLAAVVERLVNGARAEDLSAAQAQIQLAEAQFSLATLRHQRMEALFAKMATTQEDMDQANSEYRVARASLDVRREEFAKLKNGTRPEELAEAKAQMEEARQVWLLRQNGSRVEEIAEAVAAVSAAEAAKRAIERQIDELTIKAPSDGIVEAVELRPGDLVTANAPVISLMAPKPLWVRAYVPENHLGLKVGDPIEVTVDSFPTERFSGQITFVARQAEFTPGNVQTPEDRSKQVFRIKVTLLTGGDRLRPGMAADLWLEPTTIRSRKGTSATADSK